jgi:dsDNA-binding SOS-regulon protein
MAVQTLFISDRDGLEKALANPETMVFANKKEADERDAQLEFGQELSMFLTERVKGLSEEVAEEVGICLAEHRELLKKALKKPHLLNMTEDEGA